uniref:Mid2 domain-containing protein n=1 Tax=Psilocybe cubensis TaxID=181762 RepID=A0A8H7XV24_PSICU
MDCTNVGVFGTLNPNSVDGPPSSSYSIDNGTPTVFNGVQSWVPLYRQRFFASGPLSPTTHTLLITLLSKNSTYFLDYILVTLPDPGATSSSSTSFSSSSTSSSSSSSPSRSPSLRPTTTSSSTSPSSHGSQTSTDLPVGASSASHAGTIVGGVLGGIALILLALIAILYILKRRREKEMEQDFDPGTQSLWTRYTPSNAQLTPFITSRYQRIDDGQFGMLDNPRMTPQPPLVDPFQSQNTSYRGAGLNHVPLNPSSSSLPHSKSAFRKHGASPSQHSLVSQIPPTDTSSSHHHPVASSSTGRNATPSAQTRSNYADANSLPPPPRYDY